MENTKKRAFSFVLVFTVFSLFFFVMIVCPAQQCSNKTVFQVGKPRDKQTSELQKLQPMLKGIRRLTSRAFDVNGNDVMVVLHIQKTGGTFFGRNLVQNLDLERPCEHDRDNIYECKRTGSNQIWLYSRYSTGWICGPHAGWTELTSCIPHVLKSKSSSTPARSRRIFYVTWVREPVHRFLSEFGHVRRGATWKTVRHVCNGKKYVIPKCYKGANWANVTLQEFLDCPHNLAFNRQTRMLANMSSIGCYSKGGFPDDGEREKAMLHSAKKNLRALSFFGLVEYQKESQFLFEKTFGLKFREPFTQKNHTWSKNARIRLSTAENRKIEGVNKLDARLYEYARKIFFERLEHFRKLV